MSDLLALMAEAQDTESAERPVRVALSAFVLGVIAVVLAVIPGAAFIAVGPAVLGAYMGVHGVRDDLDDRWQSIVGIVLAPVAAVLALLTILGVLSL
jgi:hypothetical protein